MVNKNRQRVVKNSGFSTLRVIRILDQLKQYLGLPKMIRVDNGPEFISQKLDFWCKDNKIDLTFIQPGKPMQNGFVERFNGSFRKELFNAMFLRRFLRFEQKLQNGWMITTMKGRIKP